MLGAVIYNNFTIIASVRWHCTRDFPVLQVNNAVSSNSSVSKYLLYIYKTAQQQQAICYEKYSGYATPNPYL